MTTRIKRNSIDYASTNISINSTGLVGIGTDAPEGDLHIVGNGNPKIILENGGALRHNYIGIDASDNLIIAADEDNLGTGSTIQFRVDAKEMVRLEDNMLTLESDKTDDQPGPYIKLYRNSASPANLDQIGQIIWNFNNSDGTEVAAGEIGMKVQDVTAGAQDTSMVFRTRTNSVEYNRMSLGVDTVFNENSQATDFRVETDGNQNTFLIRGTENDILIGSSTEIGNGSGRLQVTGGSGNRAIDAYRQTTTGSGVTQGWYSDVGGTQTKTAEVECNGDFGSVTGNYGGVSDERLKQDIVDATDQWDDIKAIEFKNYRFISSVAYEGEDAPVHLGVIAQQLETAGMTGLVKTKPVNEDEPDGDDVKSVKYSILALKVAKALQEAMARIETLEEKVNALENA